MKATGESTGTANPAGSPKVRDITPRNFKRKDFFRDLKKASRRVSEKPSQRDSKKR